MKHQNKTTIIITTWNKFKETTVANGIFKKLYLKSGTKKFNCNTNEIRKQHKNTNYWQSFYADNKGELKWKHPDWKVMPMEKIISNFSEDLDAPKSTNNICNITISLYRYLNNNNTVLKVFKQ